MSSDHVAALRALAMDVRQESGASAKQRAAMGLLEILRLRRHFVELVYQTEVEKEATAKSRGLLEQADSELQNLLYERRYYESEIALCRGFMSRHSDASVSLQPVEEFWEQADEDLKTKATSRGPSDEKETMEEGGIELPAAELQRKEQHVMMLARLEHEMRLRKRLATDLESLKRKKALVVQRVQEKEKTYKSIMTTIQEVEAASAPLEPYSKPSSSLPSAPLPPPGGHELLDA